jgi:filamentous hemagglutinin
VAQPLRGERGVAGQLQDARLGSLAGGLGPEDLQRLVNAPGATRYLDNKTGNINVVQEVEGRLLRVTMPRDAFKIISVGPIRARGVANGVASGRFTPLK